MNKAAKLVSSAVLGIDCRTVIIGGQAYVIMPPTIARIAGAAYYLPSVEDCESLADVVTQMKNITDVCKALSWFIKGDESIVDALALGTLEECTIALGEAFSLIDIGNFKQLSALAKNVARLAANPRK